MLTYETILQISATITTIFQFLTGSAICQKYISKKSTGDTSGFPFLCGFLSCSLWLRYGYLTDEVIIYVVNIIGAFLMLVYSIIYHIFTVNKKSHSRQFIAIFIFLMIIIIYTKYDANDKQAKEFMGFICCAVTVLFFGAPLVTTGSVLADKSTESLPFPLILASFLVSLQWFIYGIIINDMFVQIPNAIGCLLSAVQLSLFICYPPKSYSAKNYTQLNQISIF